MDADPASKGQPSTAQVPIKIRISPALKFQQGSASHSTHPVGDPGPQKDTPKLGEP